MEPVIFRPRALGGALAVVFFLPLFVFGLYLLPFELQVGLVFSLAGALGATCGVGYLLRQVVVDDVGIRMSPGWFGGFRVSWSDIESWSIKPTDPIDSPDGTQILKLRIRGRFWSADVKDYEVGRPGFGVLVAWLRTRLGEREMAERPDR